MTNFCFKCHIEPWLLGVKFDGFVKKMYVGPTNSNLTDKFDFKGGIRPRNSKFEFEISCRIPNYFASNSKFVRAYYLVVC